MICYPILYLTACGHTLGDNSKYQETLSVVTGMAEGLSGNRLDEVRRGKKILDWLNEIKDSRRLPVKLINATLFSDKKMIIVDWGGGAIVEGVVLKFDDGELTHVPFERIELDDDAKARKIYIVFDTIIYSLDEMLLNKILLQENKVKISLSSNEASVSNWSDLHIHN